MGEPLPLIPSAPAAGQPDSPPSDSELLRRVNAGSTAAFAELYERFAARAFRVARAICRDRGTAEDAVQDGFEAIWKSRATYREDRGSAAAWALSIVRYRALAITAMPRPVQPPYPRPGEASSPPEGVIDGAVAADEAQHLRDALARLPSAQREVIILAFYGELSHREIADHLGLPPGTVKGRMRLGLEKLRSEL